MARPVLSQADRLLLHLLEMDAYREEPEVPLDASQEGIAQRLGTQVHNASRALSALEAEGLVMDRLAHVRGAPKRRRAYFLTDRGHKAASRIKDDLLKTKVVFEDRGKSEGMMLEEAVKRFQASSGSALGFLDLVNHVEGVDVVRSADLARLAAPAAGREVFVEAVSGRPKVSSFFGRDPERKALVSFVEGDKSVMLIWGIPGIGKTSLASKLYDDLSGRRHLFWYSFHAWDTEGHFATVLAKFLESAERTSTLVEVSRGAKSGDLFGPLVFDLTALKAVLFLDDVHKASGRLSLTLSVLLEAVKASGSCKVVLMSREMPPYFSSTAEGSSMIELTGLDQASARELAKNSNAKDPYKAADASRGHPLLLSLMSKSSPGESKGDIVSFIDREVSMSLSSSERTMLELLSVFRHPVLPGAIADGAADTLTRLKDKALVVEQEQGLWTHDILREFFVSRLGQESRAKLHGTAGAYCEGMSGTDWKLESLHHYVQANDFASAKRVAQNAAPEFSFEFPQETLSLLSQMPAEEVSGGGDTDILFLMGQLSESLGDDASAAKHYEACLDALPEGEASAERAMVLEALGNLKTRIEQWTGSFSAHEKALRIYQKEKDTAGQVREWLNIGGAHRMRADYAKARAAYSEALSLASTKEDRGAQAACLNNLALLEWDEGHLPEAEQRLKESVRLAHAVGNHSGEARGLENLAGLYRVQAKIAEMTKLLQESSEAFRRAGELEESKRLLALCAESLGARGRPDEGIEMCRSAFTRPELRRKKGLFQRAPQFDRGDALLSLALAALLRASGNLGDAEREVERLLDIAGSLEDAVLHTKAKLELALVKEGSGDLDSAVALLAEAEKLLGTIGDEGGLIAVHMVFGNIEEKRGNYDTARSHYEEAARQAELLGDDSAAVSAASNIEALGDNTG
jgi:tetratricopeptide (TPR) repeat protein/DNA-binding MarR family transcriptional regulator